MPGKPRGGMEQILSEIICSILKGKLVNVFQFPKSSNVQNL